MPGCICNECTNFGEATACLSPLNLRFSDIECPLQSKVVRWGASQNAIDYTVEYRVLGSGTWILSPPVLVPLTEYLLESLAYTAIYEVRVMARCATSECYTLTKRFKTIIQPV